MKAFGVTRMGGAAIGFAAATAIAAFAMPAAAQMSDDAVLNIMRECAKIDDPTSRLGCYDNNIRAGGFDSRGPVVPGQSGRVRGSGAPNQTGGSGAQGFGSEDIRSPDRFQSYEQRGYGADSVNGRVARVRLRAPGIYLVELEGGAQWLFTDGVQPGFDVPRTGDTVEIRRAALGSFLMQFDDQRSIRVRRVK